MTVIEQPPQSNIAVQHEPEICAGIVVLQRLRIAWREKAAERRRLETELARLTMQAETVAMQMEEVTAMLDEIKGAAIALRNGAHPEFVRLTCLIEGIFPDCEHPAAHATKANAPEPGSSMGHLTSNAKDTREWLNKA